MMRLMEAELHAFGKFHKRKITFDKGLQVFYGDNEAGKSTLQLFLRSMLYGMPKQGGKVLCKDRERAIPWGERFAEGVLTIEVNAEQLRVYRRFGKTPAGDKFEVTNLKTGELMAQYQKDTFGEDLLGLSREGFEKTFCICQNSVIAHEADEEISRRLMNLQDSGEEDVSAEEGLKALEKAKMALLAKDRRNTPGAIDLLRAEREKKVERRYLLQTQQKQREETEKLLKVSKENQAAAKEKEQELKRLYEKQQAAMAEQSKRQKKAEIARLAAALEELHEKKAILAEKNLTDEAVKRAELLKREIETLDQSLEIGYDIREIQEKSTDIKKRSKRALLGMGCGVFLWLMALLYGVLELPNPKLVMISGLLFGLLWMVLCGLVFINLKKRLELAEEEFAKIEAEKAEVIKHRQDVQDELQALFQRYEAASVEEIRLQFEDLRKAELERESYQRALDTLLNGEALEAVLVADAKSENADEALLSRDLAAEIKTQQEAQMAALEMIKDAESKLSYVYHGGENPADVETDILQIDAEICKLETRYRALELAATVLQRVKENRQSDFAPRLNEEVNRLLEKLTCGKYKDLRVQETYRMQLVPSGEAATMAEYYSRGTYEQFYFALRLALCRLISEKNQPLMMDDVLLTYDENRAKAALELLKNQFSDRQILLFTCQKSLVKIGKSLGIEMKDLEEEMDYVCSDEE